MNDDQLAVQSYIKQLLNWRKKNPVIANGETLHFAPFEGMYVFFRYNPTKTVMVVMNKNDKAMNVETSRFAEILKGRVHAVNIITGEKMALANSFAVPAKTALVMEIE